MNTENPSQLPEHVRRALPALQRASLLAKQTAIATNTALVVMREGKMISIPAAELADNAADGSPAEKAGNDKA